MKTYYGKILVLVMAAVIILTVSQSGFAKGRGDKKMWGEDEPNMKTMKRMLDKMAETDPNAATQMQKLCDENPEKFRKMYTFTKKSREKRDAPGRPRRDSRHNFMKERQSEYIEWLTTNYPQKAKELAELKEKEPKLYMRKLMFGCKKYGKILEAERENPKLAKVLKEDLTLKENRGAVLEKIKAATDEKEKAKLTAELETIVSDRFDLIVKRKQIAYETMSKRLEELKEQVRDSEDKIDSWKKLKSGKVKERIEQLTSETENFSWR